MSGADVTVLLNTQYGNLSALFASKQSLWGNRGFDTTNIFAVDNTYSSTPVGNEANWGQEVRFRLRKRGGKIHRTWVKVSVTAGVVAAANRAAFVDDLGANAIENCRLSYASKTLQEYPGEAVKHYRRLMHHDINREAYNAMAFGGLPPGAGGGEAQRELLASTAFDFYIPLDWLYFCRFEDYCLTPEALASELDLSIVFRPLRQMVYSRVIATGAVPVGSPFTTAPTISSSVLYQQLIHLPVPEKNRHLQTFETDQGNLYKILDFETQLNNDVAAAAGIYKIKLDNFRLDSQFIFWVIRDNSIESDYTVDRNQADSTATILPGGGSVASMTPMTSFRLLANGRVIVDTVTDIENRAIHRDIYFPGMQIAEPIYFIPFSWLLKDAKNVTSFQNMANLGNVELELTMPARTLPSIVDVYSVTHNIIQWKRGDVVKALR